MDKTTTETLFTDLGFSIYDYFYSSLEEEIASKRIAKKVLELAVIRCCDIQDKSIIIALDKPFIIQDVVRVFVEKELKKRWKDIEKVCWVKHTGNDHLFTFLNFQQGDLP